MVHACAGGPGRAPQHHHHQQLLQLPAPCQVTGGPPPPRAFHAAAAAGQTVYVTGGHVLAQEGAGAATKVFHDDLWALDVVGWGGGPAGLWCG